MKSSILGRVAVYFLLLLGTIVFAWPFLWMAATTAKLDRELFAANRLLPERPIPRQHSPYVDDRFFANVSGPRMNEVLPLIEQQLDKGPQQWPADLDPAILKKQIARGLYQQLVNTAPAAMWQGSLDQVWANIQSMSEARPLEEIISQLRRAFYLGSLLARSYDLQEDKLVDPANAAAAWQIGGNAAAQLIQSGTAAERFAELKYDFSHGDKIVLSQTFTTSFPIERLHRIQLSLRTDDTWHALDMAVEKNGKRYHADRTLESSDNNWVVATWQEPGPDDRPTKIRTWTLLYPEAGTSTINSPNELKITLELHRVTQAQAWWEKIRRNYRLTLDYIPFWRFVATSVFLVILNLVGTVISCSLVAYSFARLQWPGRAVCFALLLATMMLPPQVTMIPQFLIMQKLGWYNTLYPMWIMSFVAPAFYVFLLRQFLKGIPRDLEDAARLDGCGFLRIYWHIMLPLVRPTLAAIAIFTFIATWNDFMNPLIYLADQRLYPLSFGLYAFQVQIANPGTAKGMGMMMAGSLLMTLPVIAIFFFAQRYFLRGVTLTGMKG
ncbi:MAG: carbohydrate ABC transporter permease [Verrucomicrobiota bacterium]|nr:carbohydrate ABC transporter permease [Verrucomicrobiota bacterium]